MPRFSNHQLAKSANQAEVRCNSFERSSAAVGGQAAAEQLVKGTAHWWRHTFAIDVLQASDNNLPVVQQLLGHTSINTTAIYVKADQRERAQVVAKLSLS